MQATQRVAGMSQDHAAKRSGKNSLIATATEPIRLRPARVGMMGPLLLLSLSSLRIMSTVSFGGPRICWQCGTTWNTKDVSVGHMS